MKRHSKAGGNTAKLERRKATKPKRTNPPKVAPKHRSAATDRETVIARLTRERDEALEREQASADVLRVISTSPGDLAPVFIAILDNALRLCEAAFGVLWTYDGDRYYAAAVHGAPPAFVEFLREPRLPPYHPSSGLGRMWGGEDLAINNDMSAEEIYRSGDHCAERSSIWAVPAVQ